jgi:hypothetical protein
MRDEAIAFSERNDCEELNRKNRMKVARAFTQQSSTMCISRRAQGLSGA